MQRMSTKFGALCDVAGLACRKSCWIVDIDLSLDVPGTLDAPPSANAAERAGHKVRKDTTCSLQCIKYTQTEYNSMCNTEVTMKVYNKV